MKKYFTEVLAPLVRTRRHASNRPTAQSGSHLMPAAYIPN